MDQRASVPVSLPRDEPTVSYWQDPAAPIANHRTTPTLPEHAAIVIIGSGITGSTLAYHLLEQGHQSIVMLEARTACSGATGRNGGHTKCASYRSYLDNASALGQSEAVRIAKFEYSCMHAVHDFAREKAIQCDSWQGDTVDVFYDDAQLRSAKNAVTALQEAIGPTDQAARYQFWNAEQANSQFLSPGAAGALTYEAGSLSAYKFTIGLLDKCLEQGLNLQTDTPATELKQTSDGWIVVTPRGSISADRVVLASNGWTAALRPEFQGKIVPLRGNVTAQRPGTTMPAKGLNTTYSYIYADGYEYMISRPAGSVFEGDIIVGGGLTKAQDKGLYEFGNIDDGSTEQDIMQYLDASTSTYSGEHWGSDHPEGRIRQRWSGIMGYSPDGLPFVGQVPETKGLFIAASFQGHGMVTAFLTAKALSIMIVDSDADKGDSKLAQPEWFPQSFLITPERMEKRFRGRLHTRADSD